MMRTHLLKTLALTALMTASAAPAADPLYTLEAATPLASTDTDWDYIKLEPGTSRLFIARRKDGLSIFDVRTHKLIGQVANSIGANGPLLLPQFDRGYVAMTDGSMLIFELKSLKVIERRPLAGDGGLNGVVYDAATKRIFAVVGARTAQSAWYVFDAATGKQLEGQTFPFRKMDDPSPDGKGHLFAPARYDGLLLKLDSATLSEQARWKIGCEQVVAVEYHAASDRILVGCRGDKPVFLVIDPATGTEIARLPIGKGIDGMGIDEKRHRIVTTNGGDSTLTVIEQQGRDSYRLLGNVQTRPQARVMAISEADGRIYTVTADATFAAPGADGIAPAPVFHPGSFTVLTYKPSR
jgi:DNA-binding beta-propeller fold protein YncE